MAYTKFKSKTVQIWRDAAALSASIQSTVDEMLADGWQFISCSVSASGKDTCLETAYMQFGKDESQSELEQVRTRLDEVLSERDELLNWRDEAEQRIAALEGSASAVRSSDNR